MLADLVDHRLVLGRESLLADLLDRLAGILGAVAGQRVAGRHVGVVMLVVVELERLLRHVGGKAVVGIRQRGKRERHGGTPWGLRVG